MAGGRGRSKFKDPSLGPPTIGGKGRQPPRRGGVGAAITVLLSVLLALAAIEVGTRVVDGVSLQPRNYVAERLSLLRSAYPSVYDPLLGYIPEPSYSGTANVWGTQVTIDDRGLRQNGAGAVTPPVGVLAVGDSYTFGDEVSDAETWPAQLASMLGVEVANAGVFGYGLDQAVLRAERLTPELSPWAIVVSFIYGDVRRTQLVQRTGVEKPYFEVVEGRLVLRNVPPSEFRPRVEQMGLLRTVLGYSYLADFAFRRAGLTEWWYAGGFPQVQVHEDGPLVACLLMRRLKALEQDSGARVLVLAQYIPRNFTDPGSPKSIEELNGSRQLLDCADTAGLATVDTHDRLRELYEADGGGFLARMFVEAHMSAEGNRVVADLGADGLARITAGD